MRQDKPESVRMLVWLGADLEKTGQWGAELVGTPLQWARKMGFDECIQIIMRMEMEKRIMIELLKIN